MGDVGLSRLVRHPCALWVQVQIDVKINEWFGEFYDMIQKALGEPNAVTMAEYVGGLAEFWQARRDGDHPRTCDKLPDKPFPVPVENRHGRVVSRGIRSGPDNRRRGAACAGRHDQILTDRRKSGNIPLIESILVLIEFFPILLGLGAGITIMWFGDWEYGLVTGALIWAVGGTV